MSKDNPQKENLTPVKKGYQPLPPILPGSDSDIDIEGGYQPTTTGDNPANVPEPPKSE